MVITNYGIKGNYGYFGNYDNYIEFVVSIVFFW